VDQAHCFHSAAAAGAACSKSSGKWRMALDTG
jgi:hypothetical protein